MGSISGMSSEMRPGPKRSGGVGVHPNRGGGGLERPASPAPTSLSRSCLRERRRSRPSPATARRWPRSTRAPSGSPRRPCPAPFRTTTAPLQRRGRLCARARVFDAAASSTRSPKSLANSPSCGVRTHVMVGARADRLEQAPAEPWQNSSSASASITIARGGGASAVGGRRPSRRAPRRPASRVLCADAEAGAEHHRVLAAVVENVFEIARRPRHTPRHDRCERRAAWTMQRLGAASRCVTRPAPIRSAPRAARRGRAGLRDIGPGQDQRMAARCTCGRRGWGRGMTRRPKAAAR